jgi:hypothetical protein
MNKIAYIPEQAKLPASPATPSPGYSKLYQKNDGDWYSLGDDGIEFFAFSPRFYLLQSLALSTTTSTAFQIKASGITPVLAAGTYEIKTTYGWSYSQITSNFFSRVLLDGISLEANVANFHAQEPQDAAATQAHSFTRIDYRTFATTAAHSLQLEYRSGVAGQTSRIWNASISMKRVS